MLLFLIHIAVRRGSGKAFECLMFFSTHWPWHPSSFILWSPLVASRSPWIFINLAMRGNENGMWGKHWYLNTPAQKPKHVTSHILLARASHMNNLTIKEAECEERHEHHISVLLLLHKIYWPLSRKHNTETYQDLHCAQYFSINTQFFFAGPQVAPLGLATYELEKQIISPLLHNIQCWSKEKVNVIIVFIQKVEDNDATAVGPSHLKTDSGQIP